MERTEILSLFSDQNWPGILHPKSTVLRRKYGDFFLYRRRKRRELPTKGKATAFVDHRMSQP